MFQENYFILSLLIVIFACSWIVNLIIENFAVVQEDVDFYIVTMKGEDRMENIKKQMEKIEENNFDTKNVFLIDAIVGKNLDLDQLIKDGTLDPDAYLNQDPDPVKRRETHQREVGCYLSHMKAFETVLKKGRPGYSVIFEDDFNILDNFLQTLDDTLVKLKKKEFDVLFLGIIGYRGENVMDNVYNIHDSESWGAHGYLINNSSAAKIIDKMKYIDTVLDKEIFDKGRAKELIVYRLDPLIVDTVSLSSGIRWL